MHFLSAILLAANVGLSFALDRDPLYVISPAFGEILQGEVPLDRLQILLAWRENIKRLSGFYDQLKLEIQDIGQVLDEFDLQTEYIDLMNPRRGSWFFQVCPVPIKKLPSSHGQGQQGIESMVTPSAGSSFFGYVEYVLTNEQIKNFRVFRDRDKKKEIDPPYQRQQPPVGKSKAKKRVNICIWVSIDDPRLDGQHRIWVQQANSLNSDDFQVTFVNGNPYLDILESFFYTQSEQLFTTNNHSDSDSGSDSVPIRFVNMPWSDVRIRIAELSERPDDQSASYNEHAATISIDGSTGNGLDGIDGMGPLLRYAHDRFKAAAKIADKVAAESNEDGTHQQSDTGYIDRISPAWTRRLYQTMRAHIQQEQCDVIVIGNSENFSGDVIILDTARTLGVPTITELASVNPNLDMGAPTVIVAPSTYASTHESVVKLQQQNPELLVLTISPSADTKRLFNPGMYGSSEAKVHASCSVPSVPRFPFPSPFPSLSTAYSPPPLSYPLPIQAYTYSNKHTTLVKALPCLHVGFIGRLSLIKSPGLYLSAAQRVVQSYSFARFTVVGDGPLRSSLETLCSKLGLPEGMVQFTGWLQGEELARTILGFDMVINTSLDGETFCISNIEVMAMEVPLITFGIGGIGEYVDGGADEEAEMEGGMGDIGDSMGDTVPLPHHHTLDFCHDIEIFTSKQLYAHKHVHIHTHTNNNTLTITSNALLVNTATPEALAQAVLFLLCNPSLGLQMGRAGRATVEGDFTIDQQMIKYSNLYYSLTH